MNNFIIIKTFTYSHELLIVRGLLESEGIECRVLDELTVQVDPLYSNAIGGIKLLVRESDAERAIEILKENGYLKEENKRSPKPYYHLDRVTSKIPYLKNLRIEFRLLIVVGVITALLLGIILVLTSCP